MKEILIIKLHLGNMSFFDAVALFDNICNIGYQKTGKKFSVNFNGSKGYLDNIGISAEGKQKAGNIIQIKKILNTNNKGFKNVTINIFYSIAYGVRVSTGEDTEVIYATKVPVNTLEDNSHF